MSLNMQDKFIKRIADFNNESLKEKQQLEDSKILRTDMSYNRLETKEQKVERLNKNPMYVLLESLKSKAKEKDQLNTVQTNLKNEIENNKTFKENESEIEKIKYNKKFKTKDDIITVIKKSNEESKELNVINLEPLPTNHLKVESEEEKINRLNQNPMYVLLKSLKAKAKEKEMYEAQHTNSDAIMSRDEKIRSIIQNLDKNENATNKFRKKVKFSYPCAVSIYEPEKNFQGFNPAELSDVSFLNGRNIFRGNEPIYLYLNSDEMITDLSRPGNFDGPHSFSSFSESDRIKEFRKSLIRDKKIADESMSFQDNRSSNNLQNATSQSTSKMPLENLKDDCTGVLFIPAGANVSSYMKNHLNKHPEKKGKWTAQELFIEY